MYDVIARIKKMSLPINKIVQHFILGGLICFVPGEKSSFKIVEKHNTQQTSIASDIKGYRDIISYNGKFIAVGTDGRIDLINNSGEKISVSNTFKNNLNCAVSKDQMLVVAGEEGTILNSSDGQVFTRAESVTDKNINGITFRKELFIAGADKGTILISKNGKTWDVIHLQVKGNIESVAANDSFFFGITDSGEIIRSNDGLNWEINDYNKEYAGYNKSCTFTKVLLTENRIVIIGTREDNSPAVLFSSLGNVWTERSLSYNDDRGMIRFLTNKPNGITYDPVRDQFILACDNGEIFSLPSCTKCNTCSTVSTSNLNAIICTKDCLASVGDGFYINIINR
jgi:uncharacterized protein YrrD